MKKVIAYLLIIFLLTGCGKDSDKSETVNSVFKDEFLAISEISEAKGKHLSDEIKAEEIDEIFKGIFDLAIFESSSVEYGEVVQGAGSDGNGGKVFCCKLPVNVTFTGTEASVEKFVKYFEEVDEVISFGDFKVNETEDGKYEVNTVVNFLGKASSATVSGGKTEYTIKKNEVEVKREDEITLRDFDVSMVIRPSNSDSSAVSLGVVSDKDYRIFSAGNEKKDITVTFGNDGKYYCEYSVEGEEKEKAYISPKGNILFDILSCDIVEADDEIKTDLYIRNNTNKKVSVAVFDDEDGRVKVVEKEGTVEVR